MKQDKRPSPQPVMSVVKRDVARLKRSLTVNEALDAIREGGPGEGIVYFYVIDEEERLVGVLPTRRLLTAPLDTPLAEIMIDNVVTIPHTATVMDALEYFVLHRFMAFPVVDEQRRVVGMVDVGLFTDEVFDIAEREQMHEVFESLGFRISQVRDASPLKAFRFRFPWLVATIASGTICAVLASAYEVTLAESLVLAFFLTMVLGLGESVSVQSMTLTNHSLRFVKPTLSWYAGTFRREVGTAILLGVGCGLAAGLIVWLWHGALLEAVAIGLSIVIILVAACFFGLNVPTLLHLLKLDPKIASGPVTLAATDITTILVYFGLATVLL